LTVRARIPTVMRMSSPEEPTVTIRRFKRVEYERLTELGVFKPGERLELLDGLLVVREPQATPHATAVRLALAALRAAFGASWLVETQLPIALDDTSEPEPDVSVVPGDARSYREAHPSHPVLVVEVADTSLGEDRTLKGGLYARATIPDFWIVNLLDRVLEVYREPVPADAAPFGWRYASVLVVRPPDSVTPLAAPHARLAVASLLP
jgi:Uma2 family endonuclease